MKTSIQAGFASVLLGLTAAVLASPTIELKDGGRITGDIQSLENGVYTISSPSLGTVHVTQSNIARIVYSAAGGAPDKSSAHDDAFTQQFQQLQSSLAQDSGAMQSIMNLQSDPQIQALLNDPIIMKAVENGDFMSLLSNPKIQALENNEHVKQLVRQQEH